MNHNSPVNHFSIFIEAGLLPNSKMEARIVRTRSGVNISDKRE